MGANPYLSYARIQYHLPDGSVTRDPQLAHQANAGNVNARHRRQDKPNQANGAAGNARDAASGNPLLPLNRGHAGWHSPSSQGGYPVGGYLHVIA